MNQTQKCQLENNIDDFVKDISVTMYNFEEKIDFKNYTDKPSI